ncbi:MAG: FKBP-type peptidyl-prolyl cis-trans isomerase N-terminal domain-containing protein [Endozoicomonas sp.]
MRLKTLASIILLSYPIYATAALETKADKLSYSLGATLAEQLRQFEGLNSEALTQGLRDALAHQPLKMTFSEMKGYIQEAKAKKTRPTGKAP